MAGNDKVKMQYDFDDTSKYQRTYFLWPKVVVQEFVNTL